MLITHKNFADALEALVSIEDRQTMLTTWQGLFDQLPPKNISLDLMRRAIAYRMQEKVLGGLKPATRRYLHDLAKQDHRDAAVVKAKPFEPALELGTRLVREWRGCVHEVLIEANGVLMNGQRFQSLSHAAKAITGAHWSGPRFFGITKVKSK